MKKIKIAGIFLLVVGLLTSCGETKSEDAAMKSYTYINDASSYVLENENLKMELDPATTYFTITDKSDGAVWRSNPEGGADDAIADGESKNLLQSTLAIEYSTSSGVNTIFNNYEYSIQKGIYEIEEGKDYIKVKYSIGNTEKVFTMPTAVPESRMKEFLDKMNKSTQNQINDYYRKYNINNLRSSDNKSELLKQYPDLENECVYVLRDGLQDYLKAKIEKIFTEVGYTAEDLKEDNNRYSKSAAADKPLFNISIIYRLDDNDLVVELPVEEMEWKNSFPLTKVQVLPYLGAGSTKDDGYLLVPEGTGGVIEFNNGKKSQSSYYTDVYGWDYGMNRDALIDESRVSYPVFGIANNGNSMLCLLEDNSAEASIEADISGRNHSYNYANATYQIVHGEAADISAKSDKTVMMFESEKLTGSLKQRYRFSNSSDYGVMAETYRNYLMETYPSLVKKEEAGVPVDVNIIGAIDRVKQRLGFPVSVPEPLTTFKEATALLKSLNDTGYKNLYVKYSGWMNGGITNSVLNNVKPVSELGSQKDLKKLTEYAEEINVPIYLEASVQNAYNSNWMDGFIINRDAAKHTSREIVKLSDFSAIWYGEKDWVDSYYLLKPQVAVKYMNNLAEAADKYQAAGVAFSDVGYKLGADYNPKDLLSRQEVIKLQQKELQEIKDSGKGIIVNNGNEYVLPYADYITNMDLTGSQTTIIDYSVPFYTMAIHGLVNYSGNAINLSDDYSEMILKSAESGAGLSFTFMMEPTSTLQETYYTRYFGADYEKWKDLAYKLYSRYEEEMGACFNQYMIGHEQLSEGVFVTSYENGTKVYVNYSNIDYVNAGIKVPARDYTVERG